MASDWIEQRGALKAIQWEIAKGHLRTLAAIEGSASSAETERPYRFERVQEVVERFIRDFEDAALHE